MKWILSIKVGKVVAGGTVLAALAITEALKGQIIVAIIIATPTALIAIAGFITLWRGQQSLHITMNSRLTELLDANKIASHAAGKEEERAEEQKRRRDHK